MRASGVLLVFAAAAGAITCGNDVMCTAEWVYGLDMLVQNGVTGQPICDAVVTARDGGYSETLHSENYADGRACHYLGAGERAGTYTVRADAAGFSPGTLSDVTVRGGDCHVATVQRTIQLAPKGKT